MEDKSSAIERFTPYLERGWGVVTKAVMTQTPLGNWVRLEDHLACIAALAPVQQAGVESELVEPVAWQRKHPLNGWIEVLPEYIEFYQKQGQEIRALVPAASLSQLQQRIADIERLNEVLNERNVDNSILALKWMEAHDKLAAGKPYSFPSPADKPALLARAEAAEAELAACRQTLLKRRV